MLRALDNPEFKMYKKMLSNAVINKLKLKYSFTMDGVDVPFTLPEEFQNLFISQPQTTPIKGKRKNSRITKPHIVKRLPPSRHAFDLVDAHECGLNLAKMIALRKNQV